MYNRDYLETNKASSTNLEAERMDFLKATYQLFAGSLLAATAGAYVGLGMVEYLMGATKWVLFAVELAIIFFVIPKTKHIPGINLAVLFAFTFITGLTLAPLLTMIFASPNGASIVGQAFLMTAIAFGGISMFALTTKKDYTFMGKMLFIALIILIVGAISNIFIQSTGFQLVIASVGALIFSALILVDTQNIVKGNYDSPVEASLSLYLNFLNLFTSLLQILGITNQDD